VDVARRVLEALGCTTGEHDLGALGPGSPGRLEPDAGASADHDHGLSEELVHCDSLPIAWRAPLISRCSAFSAAAWISEKVGNGWIVSRSTPRGTRARMARVACCSH